MLFIIAKKIRDWVYKYAFGEMIYNNLKALNTALESKNIIKIKEILLILVNQPGLMPGNEKAGLIDVLLQGYGEKAHAKTPEAEVKAKEIVQILSKSKGALQKALKILNESKNPSEELNRVYSLVKEATDILVVENKIVLDGLIREFNKLNISVH